MLCQARRRVVLRSAKEQARIGSWLPDLVCLGCREQIRFRTCSAQGASWMVDDNYVGRVFAFAGRVREARPLLVRRHISKVNGMLGKSRCSRCGTAKPCRSCRRTPGLTRSCCLKNSRTAIRANRTQACCGQYSGWLSLALSARFTLPKNTRLSAKACRASRWPAA